MVSPGVPVDAPPLVQSRSVGGEIIGEIELAAQFLPGPIVAITGSNGKTTTTTLTSSPNPSTKGQTVTFTAVVTASNGSPPDGETVTFKNYGSILGTGTLSGGSAVFKTSALPVGVAKITAVYGGDKTLAGSTSNPVKQVVK